MSVDFWFGVDQADLHRVINLLPHLDWVGTRVGVRVEFASSDPVAMLANFREAKDKAQENHRPDVSFPVNETSIRRDFGVGLLLAEKAWRQVAQ